MNLPLIFKRILNPSWKLLLIWSIIIVPFFSWFLLSHSFDWLLRVRYYMKMMFGLLIILLFFLFILDHYLKMSLKKYLFLSVTIWVIICVLFVPIKKFIEKQSEIRAEVIINSVEKYKQDFGAYPENLQGQNFKNLPIRNALGNYYYYGRRADTKTGEKYFVISYFTFNGRRGSYSSRGKKWKYYEDD